MLPHTWRLLWQLSLLYTDVSYICALLCGGYHSFIISIPECMLCHACILFNWIRHNYLQMHFASLCKGTGMNISFSKGGMRRLQRGAGVCKYHLTDKGGIFPKCSGMSLMPIIFNFCQVFIQNWALWQAKPYFTSKPFCQAKLTS